MKIPKLFFIVLSLLAGIDSIGQNNKTEENENTICLRLIGLATEKRIPLEGVIVKLYKENEELQWEEITSIEYHEHSFSFDLNKNLYYTIEISKNGYVTRSIGISTQLPNSVKIDGIKFTFEFEVELFKEAKNSDDYYLDFPVALIKYNESNKVFEYDEKYTKHIKAKINENGNKASASTAVKGGNQADKK